MWKTVEETVLPLEGVDSGTCGTLALTLALILSGKHNGQPFWLETARHAPVQILQGAYRVQAVIGTASAGNTGWPEDTTLGRRSPLKVR